MAYNITLSNGTNVVIADNAVNNNFSIPLLGRNFSGYGDEMATAQLHMLEHFAADTEPSNPTPGQIWFETSDERLYVRNAANDAWLQILVVEDDGTLNVCGDILPCADITYNIGSNSLRWDQIWADFLNGTSLQAQYADLAEKYHADEDYPKGTLLSIGGEKEVTQTKEYADENTFSVVSSMPGLTLNTHAGNEGEHWVFVALDGRVPVRVIGEVKKGDRLVASHVHGVATVCTSKEDAHVSIGRALEDKKYDEEGLVLCYVSALR